MSATDDYRLPFDEDARVSPMDDYRGRCTHNNLAEINSAQGTYRQPRNRCRDGATQWLFGPDGVPNPDGRFCRETRNRHCGGIPRQARRGVEFRTTRNERPPPDDEREQERMSSQRGDPRWIVVKWNASCTGCGAHLKPGTLSFFFPETKCHAGNACGCGEDAEREYAAEMFDQEQLGD